MITHNLVQGTPQWHAYRAAHDNASDAPAMMGVSSYKTRDQLIAERATGIVPEVDAATRTATRARSASRTSVAPSSARRPSQRRRGLPGCARTRRAPTPAAPRRGAPAASSAPALATPVSASSPDRSQPATPSDAR